MARRIAGWLGPSLRPLRDVYANPALRRVQFALAGSVLGAWSYVVALGVFAYVEDGAYAVGLVGLLRWLTSAAIAPLAGLIGDRFRRTRVMLSADLVRALAMAGMAVVAFAGWPSWLVYGLSAVAAVAATVFAPAEAALLPTLARTPEELTATNVSASTIGSAAVFVGPALGGFLFAATDAETVFAVTAALSVWSALLVSRIPEPPLERTPDGETGLGREAAAGVRAIAGEPRLRLMVTLFTAQSIVDGALGVMIVLLALETLDMGASGVGLLNSAAGIGGLVGALVAAALVSRGRLASDLGTGVLLAGLPLFVLGLVPGEVLAVLLFAVVGVGNTITEVAGDTLLQRSVPGDVLARVFSALDTLALVAVAIGSASAPLLAEAFGVRGSLLIFGAVLPVLALLFWRPLRAIDESAAAPERELELLSGSPIFAPLPPQTLESLAARLIRRRVASGEVVFRQGDRGDDFYLIDSGTVQVTVDGAPTAELGPGDSFGEIALIRDVPRTATVTATSEVELVALDRNSFLAAVGAHTESSAAAEALVRSRLGTARPAPV